MHETVPKIGGKFLPWGGALPRVTASLGRTVLTQLAPRNQQGQAHCSAFRVNEAAIEAKEKLTTTGELSSVFDK